MEKCPNCGHVKFDFYGEVYSDETVLRVSHCAKCGCKKQEFLKRDKELFWSPLGTMIKKNRY